MSTVPATGAGHAVTTRRSVPWLQLLLPLGFVGLGAFALVDASRIVVPQTAGSVGPRAFPYAVGAVLVLAGLAVVVDVLRGHRGEVEAGEDVDADRSVDWRTVGGMTLAFVLLVVLVEPAGWPVAGTVLFTGTAFALGARPWWRAALIGAVLAVLVHVLFTQYLGLFLPAGPLEGVPGFG
ncbi:tripartite tricarboxylate transporter TctB family protein [Aquipuribacter hungaricus]|uniref:Tripartite tricarboxylate transporter TctB family protein n=1 Tax=Aquipuribacter hungaricus TaxID=545624 RepID=A0ABV7WB18_9MICO